MVVLTRGAALTHCVAEILPVLPDLDYASVGKSRHPLGTAFLTAGWEEYVPSTYRFTRFCYHSLSVVSIDRLFRGDMPMKRLNALTIAGTDPSGGAGIQADLKTFSALGAYGTSVVTALVAQNTRGVQSVYAIDPAFVAAQLDSVLSDVRIDSAKLGMLANENIVQIVAEKLRQYPLDFVVLDTVMLAKSGDPLLEPAAVAALRQQLLPLVSLITPNLPEAAALLDCQPATNEWEMCAQGRELLAMGCQGVLMKGGHLTGGDSPDWLFTANGEFRFCLPRIATRHTHGTGCTLSAALAALRPTQENWATTVSAAKSYLQGALEQADTLEVGQGIGPVHHFYRWW